MAQEHGAYVAGVGRGVYGHILHRNAAFDENFLPYPMFDELCLKAPVVDERGVLFEHGAADGPDLTARMLASADPTGYWVVLDEPLWTGPAKGGGPYHASVNPAIEERGGRVERGGTVEELAQRCGMEPRSLTEAVERHNAKSETKVTAPPFYGIPGEPGHHVHLPRHRHQREDRSPPRIRRRHLRPLRRRLLRRRDPRQGRRRRLSWAASASP